MPSVLVVPFCSVSIVGGDSTSISVVLFDSIGVVRDGSVPSFGVLFASSLGVTFLGLVTRRVLGGKGRFHFLLGVSNLSLPVCLLVGIVLLEGIPLSGSHGGILVSGVL